MRDEAIDLCGQVDFTRTDAMPLLERDAQFRFACAGCGNCCRGREDIVLSGFDLWRIAARLRLPPRTVARAFCRGSIGRVSRLPVLPLRGLTAFPNMIVHFDVGRMMSIRALEAAMKNGQTIFLTAQRELKTDTPTPSDLYQIGTICQIRQILRLPGDNIRVLVEGKTRALAHNFIAAEKDEDCMYAEVEELEDYVYGVTERRAQALVRTALQPAQALAASP